MAEYRELALKGTSSKFWSFEEEGTSLLTRSWRLVEDASFYEDTPDESNLDTDGFLEFFRRLKNSGSTMSTMTFC